MKKITSTIQVRNDGARISISAGAAIYPEDGREFETLYKKADAALYEAKKRGRNPFVIYRELDSADASEPWG